MNSEQSNITRSPDPVSGQDDAPSDPKTPPSDAGRPRDRAGRDAGRRNWKMFAAVCIVLFSVLVAMRVMNIMTNTPEYDEIWTVRNYRRIPLRTVFSDVSVPNNHVLNTLGIRFFLSFIPNHNLALRMTALLGFCGFFLVLLRAALLLMKNNEARAAVLIVTLLNGMILHYAETARGYTLQSLFVFGLFFSLLCFQLRPPENRAFNAVMWLLCALGACLSISSGVVYAAVLTGLLGVLYAPFRAGPKKIWREYRALILAGAAFSCFALAWYGGNYSRFAAGRAMFGKTIQSPAHFLTYCFDAARDVGLIRILPLLVLCGVSLRRKPQWRICALAGGAAVLMFLSAPFTKGGPGRMYLPLFAPAVFGVGMALDEMLTGSRSLKRIAPWLVPVLAVGCIAVSDADRRKAADPDIAAVFREVATLDPHVFVSYKPTDLYVAHALFRDAVEADDFERQNDPAMLLLLHENVISAVHDGSPPMEEQVPPGAAPVSEGVVTPREERIRFWVYRLRPLRAGEALDGKAVLCFTSAPVPEETKQWLTSRFGMVNSMLFNPASTRVCFAAVGNGLDADALLKLEQDNPGTLFFRIVADAD